MKISCAFLICLPFVVAVVSSSGKEAWKVSNFSSFILDMNHIQLWKWKVFLADLIFSLNFQWLYSTSGIRHWQSTLVEWYLF